MNNEIIERLALEVEALRAEVTRLKSLRPLFSIWNVSVLSGITIGGNNYDFGNYDVVFISTTGGITLTGIAGGVAGRRLILINSGAFGVTLSFDSASSSAANRILNSSLANITLTQYQAAYLVHSGGRWFVTAYT